MAQSGSSRDGPLRGRDWQPPRLGDPRPRHRSDSRSRCERRSLRPVDHTRDNYRHSLDVRAPVQVWSGTFKAWCVAHKVNYMEDNSVRVEWRVGDFWFGKTLCLHSEYLYMATESAVPNELTSGPLMAGSMAPSEPETHVTLSAPLAVDQDVEPLQEDALTERIIGKASVPSSCTRQKDTAVHCCGDPPLARSPVPPEPVEPLEAPRWPETVEPREASELRG